MYLNDCVLVLAYFTGHVIIIFDRRTSCIDSEVLAWRSLEMLEDLLFLASQRAKKTMVSNTGLKKFTYSF